MRRTKTVMSKVIFVEPGGGFDAVVVGESEVPEPQSGEITVRLHASCSIIMIMRW
jgi:hypothetical protein